VNTYPQNALQILQLLLRCGMVCREELNVVLEMMAAASGDAASAAQERNHEQRNLILEVDSLSSFIDNFRARS
jgi:hypothetical protein